MRIQQVIQAFLAIGLLCDASLAIERVYLKSGSTLLAESHNDKGRLVEVMLYSGSKVSIDSSDIDKITIETSAPIDLSKMEINPEEVLPDVQDPLNDKWLDVPSKETEQAKRFFLTFEEQLARGITTPIARSLNDIKMARSKKVREIEFVDTVFYLGMDYEYHDDPGIAYEEAFERLLDLEDTKDVDEVVDFIGKVRNSKLDPRKEALIASAIELRDRLAPNYNQQLFEQDQRTARADLSGSRYSATQ
ncbi:MAG: hypothetical protein KC917_12270 [Candidatus Omnitrophica bacterium]|nr:hypothetical protein [Candidatus Omnitrophota bacterium]MCA9417045.1 hypothetical protein [Candidatus Omnitrophota bacterium]